MNDLPQNQEMMRKMVMGVIEDSLQGVTNDRLREETFIFWDKITYACDEKQLKKLYYNVNKYVNSNHEL